MKGTRNIALLIFGAVILILFFWGCNVRNGLADAKVDIKGKWGEVENQFDRKMKLYENVVATIKGSAKFEDTVLTNIIKMRSRIPQVQPNNPQSLIDANAGLDQLKATILNINVEAYPTLQTTQAFREFQTQIDRTENRVAVAIMDWNNGITGYNKKIVKFPNNIIAGMFGYKEMENYKATPGAKDAKVDFSK